MTTLTEIAMHKELGRTPSELRVSRELLEHWFKDFKISDRTLDHMLKRINGYHHAYVADLYLQVINDEMNINDMLKEI